MAQTTATWYQSITPSDSAWQQALYNSSASPSWDSTPSWATNPYGSVEDYQKQHDAFKKLWKEDKNAAYNYIDNLQSNPSYAASILTGGNFTSQLQDVLKKVGVGNFRLDAISSHALNPQQQQQALQQAQQYQQSPQYQRIQQVAQQISPSLLGNSASWSNNGTTATGYTPTAVREIARA